MMAFAIALLIGTVFLGPLAWRIWLDVRQARADQIAADVRAGVNRRLRGESLLSVLVTPKLFWRPGRIVVSVPSGYEFLVESAWPALTRYTPPGYELVVRAGTARAMGKRPEPSIAELPRAA